MTEKEKESQEKTKSSGSRSRSGKAGAGKTSGKTTTRAKSKTTTKKSEAAGAAAEKKPRGTRGAPRRTKPKVPAATQAELRFEPPPADSPNAKPLVQNVAGQLPVPAPAAEDLGASALAEWAAQTGEPRPRRGLRAPTRPRPEPKPAQPPATKEDLLDVPAWPELSDGPSAPALPPSRPVPPKPPEPVRRAAEAPRRAEAPPVRPVETREVVASEAEVVPSETKTKPRGEPAVEPPPDEAAGSGDQPQKSRRRRRRRRGRHRTPQDQEGQQGQATAETTRAEPSREPPARPQPGRPEPSRTERGGGTGRDNQPQRAPRPERRDRGQRPEQAPAAPPDDEREPAELMTDLWDTELEEEPPEPVAKPDDKNGRLMLINVAEGEECRIAILHQKRLEELFIERASAESHVGNIYKGRITNVEPSIQAAFVDFGLPKNGFLHISDLQPQYFPGGMKTVEEVGRKTPRRDRPPIQKCLRRGQEIIVQIIKEGIGTKGPTLTTYISIPGRYLVMMPGMNRLGVSRRIEDDDARRKMRSILDELSLPKEMGFILRTAGLDRTKRELQQDLLYLQRLWKVVARRIKSERAPCELYRESDLVIRTIRDVFSSDFSRIIVDDARTAEKVRDFLAIAMPRSSAPVNLYTGHRPLFHEYKLEQEIERINSRYVPLPSGGSLVIESTEALVAIDVNSGKYREHDDAEETAYRINIEAAEEIARQLRLRDLGGLILCDFIDMRAEKHRRGVERALRDALKKHKERAKCLRMSQFGIIEMTRQRMRPSIKRSIYQDCAHCRGTGLIKNTESMTLDIMRLVRLATHHDQVDTVEIRVAPEVGSQLQNRKRAALCTVERETGRHIIIRTDPILGPDQYSFECLDRRGGIIRMEDLPDTSRFLAETRSKRRSGGSLESKPIDNGRQTLEDVFD